MCSLDALLVNSSSLTLPLCSKLLIVAELGNCVISFSRSRTNVLFTFLDLGHREDCSDTDMSQQKLSRKSIRGDLCSRRDIARNKWHVEPINSIVLVKASVCAGTQISKKEFTGSYIEVTPHNHAKTWIFLK